MSEESSKVIPFSPNLPITQGTVDSAIEQRKLLSQFVQSQLRKGVDYGVIPGTSKDTLYKPGAEKFAKLFNLTKKIELTDKEVNRHENFAMFTYRATIFHGPSGKEIAQLEASCNSQEKKYQERRKYTGKGKEFVMEETPICDVLNTLQKMAQKRAFVGAVIEACGASDFYTQDIDDPEDAQAVGVDTGPGKTTAKVNVKVKNAKSEQSVKICECGNQMMISKFNENQWYCGKCKTTEERGE